MGFLVPFVSAAAAGVGSILDKLNLQRKDIEFQPLLIFEFVLMFAALAAFALVVGMPKLALTPLLVGLFAALVLISFAQNIFELKGIQAMHMNLREPIRDLEPILAGVLAYLIFPSEGNVQYLVAIVIGAVVVMWSNSHRFSFSAIFNKKSGYVFADVSLGALDDNLTKFLLLAAAPAAAIPLVRIGGVLLLSLAFLRPRWRRVRQRGFTLAAFAGLLFAGAALTRVFAIQALGLNLTILILLLEPGIVYLLSRLVLRERFEWRPIISSAIILGLIVAVR